MPSNMKTALMHLVSSANHTSINRSIHVTSVAMRFIEESMPAIHQYHLVLLLSLTYNTYVSTAGSASGGGGLPG